MFIFIIISISNGKIILYFFFKGVLALIIFGMPVSHNTRLVLSIYSWKAGIKISNFSNSFHRTNATGFYLDKKQKQGLNIGWYN